MRKVSFALALLASLLIAAPAFATEPGTPMDCSDLELAPGLACSEVTEPLEDRSFGELPDKAIDNDGRVLVLLIGESGTIVGNCGAGQLRRRDLVIAFDGEANVTALVTATDRCVGPAPPGTFSETLSWIARIDGFASLPQVLPPQCRNGLDDDGDGQVDADDQQCKSDSDNDESRP